MATSKSRTKRVRNPDNRVRITRQQLDDLTTSSVEAVRLAAQLRTAQEANASLAKLAQQHTAIDQSVLGQAAKLVDGDRQAAYGDPKANFDCASAMAAAYLTKRGTTDIDAHDWAMLNVIGKIARQAHSRTTENLVDMAGYVRTAEMVGE